MNSASPATPFPLLPPTNPAAQWQSNQTKIPCDARHPIRHPRHNSDRDADASLFPPFTAFLSTLFRSTLILADLQSSSSLPSPSIDKSPSTKRLHAYALSYPNPLAFEATTHRPDNPLSLAHLPTLLLHLLPLHALTHTHTRACNPPPRVSLSWVGRVRMSSPTALTRFTLESLLCRGSSPYNSRVRARFCFHVETRLSRLDTTARSRF